MVSHTKMLAHNRIDRWQTNATCSKDYGLTIFILIKFTAQAQGTGDTRKSIANFHLVNFHRAASQPLYNEYDSALFGIPVSQGHGNQFTFIPGKHSHKLTGACCFCDQW